MPLQVQKGMNTTATHSCEHIRVSSRPVGRVYADAAGLKYCWLAGESMADFSSQLQPAIFTPSNQSQSLIR
eukprot:c13182_g1_i1 orf=69-281(+)